MAITTPMTEKFRRAFAGFAAPKAEQEMLEEQGAVRASGATPISDCGSGSRTTVCGVLKSVSLRPRAGVPALEADLFDGSGHLRLVFLGRRAIAGIEPGRRLLATGRVTCSTDESVMFNPRYQLLPGPDAE